MCPRRSRRIGLNDYFRICPICVNLKQGAQIFKMRFWLAIENNCLCPFLHELCSTTRRSKRIYHRESSIWGIFGLVWMRGSGEEWVFFRKERKLGLVTFRKDFSDRYPVKVPEVFAKVNSTYSLSQNGWDTLGSPCALNVGVQDLVTKPR